ncbi:MAG: thioredoxin family protein [Candidatus Nanoarchaeia archaeon]
MVMIRSFRRGRYVIAFFLTSAIFIIGILLGFIIADYRSSDIEDLSKVQRLDYDSLQLQYLYINNFLQQKNCPAAMSALNKNLYDLEMTRLKLESYISNPVGGGSKEFDIVKREYLLAEIRYWLFLKQIEGICKDDSVTLLYFYSNENCPDCVTQGMILTYLKDKLKDRLLIFSLDADFVSEPLVGILKDSYNITSVPAVVIQNSTYQGLRTREELKTLICKQYDSTPKECIMD